MSATIIIQMKKISGNLDLVVNDRFPKTVIANDIINEINVVARALRNIALLTDSTKIPEEYKRITGARKTIGEKFDSLSESIKSTEGKKQLNEVLAARQLYLPVQDQILKLLSEKKKDAATALLFGEFRDLQNNYLENISKLIELQTNLTNKDGEAGLATAKNAEVIIYLLAGFILLFSIVAAVFITGSITRPISQCIDIANKVAAGDTSMSIKSDSKDETGILLKSLEKMVGSIKSLVSDAAMLSKAAVDGKLDTRADASKHQGDYRIIVEGVNSTLDSVIGPLNVAAEYVDRISKGDIPQRITDTYHGDFNEIKNNLNQCIDVVNRLVKDAEMLSKAAVDGKLATRADASKHEGDFRKIVQGVNDTLDAVIGPLNVAAKYVDEISKGAIPQKITDSYNGDFNTIKNNLNKCIDAVNKLVADAAMLSKAAVDGKLATRADATKHEGDFGIIVQGVNDTLDAVIGPLNVAAKYVDDISKGAIPPKITDNYNGDFNTIKNNLNTCIDAVNALVTDANMLSFAAVEGKLSTRADASKHQGDFRKIVQGVNDCLDAVIGPINEAALTLEKVAARDMTARMLGDYKGDLAKIKNSLNLAVDNLDKALQQVSEAAEQVTSASNQISSGSQSLAQGANEQASSLEEVSSSLEEMASMTKQNADNATQAKSLSGEADENAKVGTEAMLRMSSAINKIKESSDQTAKIVKTIDEIAMQTNLLALNAAVEAARAGEAGRGFAVVAEEVRNLAQRSAQAAKNTADMISESVKNADDGVKIADEVSQSFESIATSAKKVNDLIAEIAAASQEQSQGIDQVNSAVAQMDKVTQQNAANSEESASAAEELSSQAEELKTMIDQFDLNMATTQHRPAIVRHDVKKDAVAAGSVQHIDIKGKKAAKKHAKPDEFLSLDDSSLKDF
jgi:methyl-accepting chemotaxis protein